MNQKTVSKSFKRNLRLAVTVFLIALIALSSFIFTVQQQTLAAVNGPIGEGKGIFPGRVVWAHNADSTSYTGTNGYWWEDKYTDQSVVDKMVSDNIQALTGMKTDLLAWSQIFKHYNKTNSGKSVGYKKGEKIVIKVNMNGVNDQKGDSNFLFTSPHVMYSMLMQLVTKAGVNPSDIVVYDASRFIPNSIFNKCNVARLKGVQFVEIGGGNGRIRAVRDTKTINWSFDVKGNPAYLPTVVTQAKYMINIFSLKAHNLAGVTLSSKNHFGTIIGDIDGKQSFNPPQAANLHGFVTAHDYGGFDPNWTWSQRPMGTYNPLVDIMGHKDLGGKTILYMMDALYSSIDQSHDVENKYKWKQAPFNNDWPSSIFVSQDPVAIDSVGYDFIKNEPMVTGYKDGDVFTPNSTAENYLHEAALANNPPSKTIYDPEGDKTRLKSLGVHEHWNSATDKKYSKNLGKKTGIELVTVKTPTSKSVKGLWTMESLTNTDKSTYKNIATKKGTPTLVNGKFGKGIKFNDNTKTMYTVPDTKGNLTNKFFTVSCWVNVDEFRWSDLIEKCDQSKYKKPDDVKNNYCIFLGPEGKVYTGFKTATGMEWKHIESKGKLTLNKWHHIAGTYDGRALRLYIDGKLDSSLSVTKIPVTNNEYLAIGGGANGAYFSGIMDEAVVLDYAASIEEINDFMKNGVEKTYIK